jgi:hypothetical protein
VKNEMRISKRVLGAAAVAALVTAAAGVALADSQREAKPVRGAPGTVVAEAPGAAPAVRARFGVLRTKATPGDVPSVGAVADAPGAQGADLDASFVRANGINVRAARRVSGTRRVFVVPGNGVTCLATGEGAVSCTPDEHVGEDFGVETCGGLSSGSVSVSGLIADGTTAKVRLKNGTVQPMNVERSFGQAIINVTGAGDLPQAVELTTGAATRSIAVSETSLDQVSCAPASG